MVSDMEANSAALSMSTTLVAFTTMSFWVTGQLKGLALLAHLGVLASPEGRKKKEKKRKRLAIGHSGLA